MNSQTKSKSGFTIIEVVLVLAIAGLIFLIVFLAVPALQRSQRDTARKNDLGRLVAAVQSYQSNNQGKLPSDLGGTGSSAILGTNYVGTFADPSGGNYTFAATTDPTTATPNTPTSPYVINYKVGVDCNNASKGSRTVAVLIGLEGGGNYCQTN